MNAVLDTPAAPVDLRWHERVLDVAAGNGDAGRLCWPGLQGAGQMGVTPR